MRFFNLDFKIKLKLKYLIYIFEKQFKNNDI